MAGYVRDYLLVRFCTDKATKILYNVLTLRDVNIRDACRWILLPADQARLAVSPCFHSLCLASC